jgi:hypothetical protein
MKKTILVVSSNREIALETQRCIAAIKQAGAPLILERGSSDPAQARNSALTEACDMLRLYPDVYDTILMLDDDIICPLDAAQTVVDESRRLGFACSAMYITAGKKLAGGRWAPPEGREWPEGLKRRWCMGLGCMAIPARLLLELEQRTDSYSVGERVVSEFCWSRAEGGHWIAEDYRLCRQLGGVHLLPLAVGHLKVWPIYPDAESVAAVMEDRMTLPVQVVPKQPGESEGTYDPRAEETARLAMESGNG